jgi:hypothetical protein
VKQLIDVLAETKGIKRPKNLVTEFQQFGVFIADSLGDAKHYSLYVKLAKTVERAKLEEALTYAKGYTNAKSKARVFMWRLTQLRRVAAETAKS